MKNKILVGVRLEEAILNYLKKLAKENHTNISHEIRRILLENYKTENK